MPEVKGDITQSLSDARRGASQRVAIVGVLAITSIVLIVSGLFIVIPDLVPEQPAPEQEAIAIERCRPAATVQECPERQAFIDAARDYDAEVKPALDRVSLAQWQAAAFQTLVELEQTAHAAFAKGRYEEALATMQQASVRGREEISRAAEVFTQAMIDAADLLKVGDPQGAMTAINLATRIDPQNPEAQALKQRIAVLPQVLDLLEAAFVARAENRPQVESEALREVLQLDPERVDVAARIAALQSAIREQTYGAAVVKAEESLMRGDLDAARRYYQEAEALVPGRNLDTLRRRLELAEQRRDVTRLLRQAEAARAQDDWQTAAHGYAAVLKLEPDNSEALQGQLNSRTILRGWALLKPYLQDPLRVADLNIGDHPRELLQSLSAHAGMSERLATELSALERALALSEQPAQVRVISDGATYVRVLKVGLVGKSREKLIELKPGRYKFEGTRTGYRSVIVPFEVPLGAGPMDIKVVCVERI